MRPQDERFWEQYRTTPKAFVSLEAGQRLWRSRYGELTSIRVRGSEGVAGGSRARRVPAEAACGDRSAGARAHGEQRPRAESRRRRAARRTSANTSSTSVSSWSCRHWCSPRCSSSWASSSACVRWVCLRAVGFGPGAGAAAVPRRRSRSSLSPAACSASLGALAYAAVIMYGLRTWWVDAVGTTSLTLHVTPDVAGGGRDRRSRRRGRVHLVDAACRSAGSRSGVCWLGRSRRDDDGVGGCQRPAATGSLVATVALARRSASRCSCAGSAGWIAREGAFFGAGSRCSSRRCACSRCATAAARAERARRAAAGSRSRVSASATRAIVPGAACCRWP